VEQQSCGKPWVVPFSVSSSCGSVCSQLRIDVNNLRYCLLDWPVPFVPPFHLRRQTCDGNHYASTSLLTGKSIQVVYKFPQPNISHRLPQFPIVSALLRLQIVCQEAHRLILPPLRRIVLAHFHTLTRCIISTMGASATFITSTALAAVTILISLGGMWRKYFRPHHQGKSPDMFL
jgi:hypothetical protein